MSFDTKCRLEEKFLSFLASTSIKKKLELGKIRWYISKPKKVVGNMLVNE
jgi:hypothetical protein